MRRRLLLPTALILGCAATQPAATPEPAGLAELPASGELCEQLTQASDEGPYGSFYQCRLEGQTCIVFQFASDLGGLAIDCEDDED